MAIPPSHQTGSLRQWQGRYSPSWLVHNWRITNPRWRTATILEMHKHVNLGQFLGDLYQIWSAASYWPYKGYCGPKIVLVENTRWRWPPSCILFFSHNSVANEDICGKFIRSILTGHMRITTGMAQNPTFNEIQDGGGHHLENTQTGVSRPTVGRFAPNLVYSFILAIYDGYQGPKIAFVRNSKWRWPTS